MSNYSKIFFIGIGARYMSSVTLSQHGKALTRGEYQGFFDPVPTRMSLPQSEHSSMLSVVNSPVVLKDTLDQPLGLHSCFTFFSSAFFHHCVAHKVERITIRY